MRIQSLSTLSAVSVLAVVGLVSLARPQAPNDGARPSPAGSENAALSATLTRYCVTCHDDRLKTAGLAIDPAGLSDIGSGAATWEKVLHKLRTGDMPPPRMPRPDEASRSALVAYLETELDRAAAEYPNPGQLPQLHRLTRTEYRNSIRDLLGLDALPKEIEVGYLLPADNSSSGFDNLADLLFVSPTTMERYLDAARKISRFALGDPDMPVMVNIHPLPTEQPQGVRVDELPFGTRGGLTVRSEFPVDADYVVEVDLAGQAREPHQLELMLDGKRMELVTIGGPNRNSPNPKEFRIPVEAGTHVVGVAFVRHTDALNEAVVVPRPRSRGTEPSVASVVIKGPYDVRGRGNPESRQQIFVCRPQIAGEELPCARRILSTLQRRAYRRPATEIDLGDLMPFYEAGRAEGGFELGIQKALERLLTSPQFLYRIERVPENIAPGTAFPISDLELASRLSFFLWSSIPDEILLQAAEAEKLSEPAELERQVRRMLADPRAKALVTNFAEQWLYLRDVEAKRPDEILFREFDENLRAALRQETQLFLESILLEGRSVLDLLTANHTFVNERLAKHYGIPNVQGSYFRRVTLPEDSPRKGLLGQGSILTLTSYSTRTSPVLRGKYVLENLLASPPPPPPPDVPALKTEGSPGESLSMREAMVRHRADPVCASCHARMDPIGFAMENFDGVGQYRTADAGKPIDNTGELPDGTKFEGMDGLRKLLLSDPDRFVEAVTEKLTMYAVGRNVQYYDKPAIREIVRRAAPEKYSFLSLVLGVVQTDAFRMRLAEEAPKEIASR